MSVSKNTDKRDTYTETSAYTVYGCTYSMYFILLKYIKMLQNIYKNNYELLKYNLSHTGCSSLKLCHLNPLATGT